MEEMYQNEAVPPYDEFESELHIDPEELTPKPEKKRSRPPVWVTCLALLVAVASLIALAVVYNQDATEEGSGEQALLLALENRNFHPVTAVMEACGYALDQDEAPLTYVRQSGGKTVTVTFDFAAGQCKKDGYTFDLDGKWIQYDDQHYVDLALLGSVTNCNITASDGEIQATRLEYAPHQWTEAFAPLIAHAGGAYRKPHTNQTYANGLGNLVQNYDLGHRVFEIDFQLTSDGDLAAVHEGMVPGDETGIFMTAAEWKEFNGIGYIGSMLVGDVLDQMIINEDMFVVTDTKWKNADAFVPLYTEAQARDLLLLDRIIPQIYNMEMYDGVMEIYPFPSVIFTTYDTDESPQDVVAFCREKGNIRVITVDASNTALLEQYRTLLEGDSDLLLYVFTLNGFNDITVQRNQGVYGLYTDLLLPSDFQLFLGLGSNS